MTPEEERRWLRALVEAEEEETGLPGGGDVRDMLMEKYLSMRLQPWRRPKRCGDPAHVAYLRDDGVWVCSVDGRLTFYVGETT